MSLAQQTYPSRVDQATMEDVTYGVDCTALLAGTQTVSDATAVLNGPTGPIALLDGPDVVGNVVQQRVRAGVLTAGTLYQLIVTANPSDTTNVLAAVLAVNCPF